MALDRLTADVAYIAKLDNYPPDDPGMTPNKLKLLFDQGSVDIKNFLNNKLIPQIEEQLVSNAENAQLAEEKAAEAAQSAASASVSAAQAQGYADSARESADSAASSASIASAKASEAAAAKEAIENLSVSATGLPAGSEPAVTKIVEDGIVTLVFSIPEGKKGKNLEFVWDGTRLGVRVEGDGAYQYVDLKGETGPAGRGIASVTKKSGTGAPGTYDTYTITFTDGTTFDFQVYNGANGEGSGDMVQAVYDPTGRNTDIFGYVDNKVKTNVPAGAKFTDTAYARFVVGTSTSGWTEKDCDYLCDGTNDQEEIIQALNDLPETGGEVVILDGTYNITASINIPKNNVSIRGSGNATTLKRMYNSTNADSGPTAMGLITLSGKSGCQIQSLQIDGNKAIYTAIVNYGIYLHSSSNNTVTGSTCSGNAYGINLYSSNNNTIIGNTCNNNSYDGICLYSSSNNTITGNTFNNNSICGIEMDSSSDNNTITGNICSSNSVEGILLSSSSNNTVTSNTCNNNNNDGISLFSSHNNTVTGNTCNNNSFTGIYLDSSNNNTVTGNTCIRGTGQTSDYASDQYTILLSSTNNNYNLISSNNCMGKAVAIEGGTGNSAWGNKFDNTDDLPGDCMPKSGGTFTGIATAQSNTSYTTPQIRNIVLSTSDPSGGNNGEIWIKYQ